MGGPSGPTPFAQIAAT
ncbi:DUF6053 domain-containing protein [Lysobacter enzymogenes]